MAVPRFRVTERQVLMALLVASFVVFGGAFVLSGFRQRGERRERTSQPRAESVQSSVEKLPATAQDTLSNETFAATAATQSTLHVEGELEQRDILEIPNLPMPAVDAGLRPTRVRVAVAADGRVRYATLDRSCGNEAVDGQALELARRLIFERTSSADPLSLTWGTLKFSWAVTASK